MRNKRKGNMPIKGINLPVVRHGNFSRMNFSRMANETYKQFQLMDRFSDITLSNTILVIIGAFIGVIGNTVVIFFYFFRIKERGERYFIPLLGIVDLLGCLISPPYYIMDNMYLLSYPSTSACRILSFVQIFIPGISGHTLLVISIQRYFLSVGHLDRKWHISGNGFHLVSCLWCLLPIPLRYSSLLGSLKKR